MINDKDLKQLALDWHNSISPEVVKYLLARGLSEESIHKVLLGSNVFDGELRLTIPIFDKDKTVIAFKTRNIPGLEKPGSPKYLNYPTGVETSLYGVEQLYD